MPLSVFITGHRFHGRLYRS